MIEYKLFLDQKSGKTILKEKDFFKEDGNYNNPEKIVHMMNTIYHMNELATEHLYMLVFNPAMRGIGVFEVSSGSSDNTMVDPRSIFTSALLLGGNGIILVHNHPGGSLSPSQMDVASTKQVVEAGKILNLPLHDHIIVAGESYTSMKEVCGTNLF